MNRYSMDIGISLGNITLTDETYIANLDEFPDYQYKAIMGHVALGGLDLDDCSLSKGQEPEEYLVKPDPIHRKVPSLDPGALELTREEMKKNPLVKLSVNMFNDVEQEYPGYAMKIDLGIKGMRFTFLNRFVDEMLKWLMNSALLKIPQLITDQLAKSELMAGHDELTMDAEARSGRLGVDADIIPEDAEVNPTDETLEDDQKGDVEEEASALPQMRIAVENMELGLFYIFSFGIMKC